MVKKIKASKTVVQQPKVKQGKYRWSIEYNNGNVMDKYNADGTKNVYCQKQDGKPKVFVPLTDVASIGLTDADGNIIAAMPVPDGAVVFQRRRVRDINYYNRFHTATTTVPAGAFAGRWYPERQVTKTYPEYTYGECWLIGWRTSTELRYKCVYPDGKVEEYTEWGVKPWLYEPQWFPDEGV